MEMCSNSIFIPLTIYYAYLLSPILQLIITTYVHVFLSQDEVSILIRHFKKNQHVGQEIEVYEVTLWQNLGS